MSSQRLTQLLRWVPLLFFAAVLVSFGVFSPQFLTAQNMGAILVQSCWLVVVATGVNLALLTAGVDLSVGAIMYLAAIAVTSAGSGAPLWILMSSSIVVGALFGGLNGALIVRLGLPAFIVTLATTFIGRGLGLYLTSTRIVYADADVAGLGRASFLGLPVPLWIAGAAIAAAWLILTQTALGTYIRSIGADTEGARRAGVPVRGVTWSVYLLCGAFAGLAGFISLSQTSAASGAFGQNSEFLAIAAAVLGGTSLFGGRGSLWAPVIGAVLIMTVQNGLTLIDANPYAYPVITGTVIFLAALIDSLRSRVQANAARRGAHV